MPGETGPTLDDEGIPDLMGPLPEKERTGDPQEGLAPPGDRPHADEWGTTGDEMAAGEPLDLRVAHEIPDIGETDPVDDIVRDLGDWSSGPATSRYAFSTSTTMLPPSTSQNFR